MPIAKPPAIPTTEPALMRWILQDLANVRTYITSEGEHWINATRARVRHAFGKSEPALATSIAMEALAALFSAAAAKKLNDVIALGPWIDGTIRHMVSKAFKGYVRDKRTVTIDLNELLAPTPEASDAEESAIIIRHVQGCLNCLSPRERQILEMMLHDLDNPPSHGDVATVLGCSPGSVRTQYSTGRARMIDCLTKKGVRP